MAPTTRKQSRMLGPAETPEVGIELETRTGTRRVSRKSSLVEVGKQETEEIGKVDETEPEPTRVEHASPHAHFNISSEPEEHNDSKHINRRSPPNSRILKERT
jgi:hypothetical protein